jgi:hypothetical protein
MKCMSSFVHRDRPTAEHIMKVLEANKGLAFQAASISRLMIAEGHVHTMNAILDNCRILIKQGKMVKIDRNSEHRRNYYGIPLVREDGSRYLIETLRNGSKREIEVWKVKKDGQ